VSDSVNEERRGSVDTASDSALEILVHANGKLVVLQLTIEPLDIKADLDGVSQQRRIIQMTLILVESIVHLPEFALRPGRFGCLGGVLGVRMLRAQWKVPKHQPHPIADLLLQVDQDRIRLTAVWTLVVTVFNQHDGGRGRSLNMVSLTDRQR
jgi:hypothetical protein